MSDIPISSSVKVSITSTPTAPSRKGFGVMLCVTQETGVIDPVEAVRFYNSIDAVAADWASTTEVNKAATAYFSQVPRPETLAVGVRFIAATAGILRSSANAEEIFSVWTAVTDGEFAISIDGDAQDITGVTFAGDLDMDDVASTIQVALQAVASGGYVAATCTWDTEDTVFRITSGTTGATSTVSFLSAIATPTGTDISGSGEAGDADAFFQGRQGQGTKVAGLDAEAAVGDALTRMDECIIGQDRTWYAFGFTKETRDNQDIQDAASWAEARIKQLWTTSNNEDAFQSGVTTDIGSILNALNYRRTWVQASGFPNEYPEFSGFGRAATVDFDAVDSTITMKWKQLPGISTENITQAKADIATAKGYNVYVTVGGSPMNQQGNMVAGVGTWQDAVHGIDWLQNAMETNVFGRLYQEPTKVPYTDEGGQIIAQEIEKALEEGVRNGLIAPGTDINGVFLPLGYTITVPPVDTASATQESNRQYPPIQFYALGAGAIHGIDITGVFEG